ncbi:MAG TPA: patatin-like phospholipase family protein [Rhodocyclaceae bacterium]|nr:patatin-like phospholipase family protein [Rhodocyclaceae bacterium]
MNALTALMGNALLIMVFAFSVPGAARAETVTKSSDVSIGLALGSGGASGLAHIAMLQVFDDLGIRPQVIAGTSIGAVIGALYASGLSAREIRAIFDEFGGSSLDAMSALMDDDVGLDLGKLLTIDMSNGGLIDQSGFLRFLASKTTAKTFADLEIPLRVIATDYWSGETIVLDSGDLIEAAGASMAVPGLFAPLKRDERLLIDGGTSDPLPWNHLTGCCDLIVAVDVSGSRRRSADGLAPLLEVLFNTFEIMQQSIVAEKMRHGAPDIYIKPDISGIRLLHFNRIETILEQAEPAARQLRDAIEQRLGPRVSE